MQHVVRTTLGDSNGRAAFQGMHDQVDLSLF